MAFSTVRIALAFAPALAFSANCRAQSTPGTLSDDLEEREAAIVCSRRYECCASLYPGTAESCRPIEKLNVSARGHRIADAVGNGAATYDEARFVACLDLLERLDCAGWIAAEAGALPAPCLDYVRGKAPLGAPCDDHFECASGRCSGKSDAARGVCAERGREGDACNGPEEDCEPALRCRPDTNVCVLATPTGGACEREADCDSRNCEAGVCVTECQLPL